MLAKVLSSGVIGIDAYQVEVEVDSAPGTPHSTVVGLPDAIQNLLRRCLEKDARNRLSSAGDIAISLVKFREHAKRDSQSGTVVVASGGNAGGDGAHYPSDYPEAIGVAWFTQDGSAAIADTPAYKPRAHSGRNATWPSSAHRTSCAAMTAN